MKRELVIQREGQRFQYHVEVPDTSTLLDAMLYVQRNLDSSLVFRYSCRQGMCGSCGVRVNGVERLACSTRLSIIPGTRVLIEPLRHLPLIRDLIVDFKPFFERWATFSRFTPESNTDRIRALPEGAQRLQRDCISCALCYSACDTVGKRTDFVGPAALYRAYVLALDPRDEGTEKQKRMQTISGVLGCHTLGVCTRVCPKGLDPAGAIQRLRWLGVGKP